MTFEQHKRAGEIIKAVSHYSKRRDELLQIEHSQFIAGVALRGSGFSNTNYGISNTTDMEHEPEYVQTVLMASVIILRGIYEKEIAKLEKEFGEL